MWFNSSLLFQELRWSFFFIFSLHFWHCQLLELLFVLLLFEKGWFCICLWLLRSSQGWFCRCLCLVRSSQGWIVSIPAFVAFPSIVETFDWTWSNFKTILAFFLLLGWTYCSFFLLNFYAKWRVCDIIILSSLTY